VSCYPHCLIARCTELNHQYSCCAPHLSPVLRLDPTTMFGTSRASLLYVFMLNNGVVKPRQPFDMPRQLTLCNAKATTCFRSWRISKVTSNNVWHRCFSLCLS